MKQVYGSSETSGAPVSSAWEVNGLLFVSGQIHADAEWKLVGSTIEERFAAAMANVSRIVGEAGLTVNDIMQIAPYLIDLSELPALNEAYRVYFKHPLPARTAVEVSRLPLGASLEIEAVAAR